MDSADKKTGAHLLYDALLGEGVDVIFGYPGSDMLPLYDLLYDSPHIRHILVRHEQAAAHAADGYARASGKPGVCMASSGPGSTNLITGIAAAYADSIPLVALAFNAPSAHFGKGVFQEADIISISKTIVKENWRIEAADEIPAVMKAAFARAKEYPHGPVLIDIPSDMMRNVAESKAVHATQENQQRKTALTEDELSVFFSLLSRSQRPVFIAGNGIVQSRSHELFRQLTDRIHVPVASTVSGVGSIDEHHPLSLHVAGVLGTPYANSALQKADLVVAWGMHFEPRSTALSGSFAPDAAIVQIDIDHGVCGRFIHPSECLNGDIGTIVGQILNDRRFDGIVVPSEWLSKIALWKNACALRYEKDSKKLQPQAIMETLEKIAPDVRIFSGNGLHKYWALRHFQYRYPGQWNTSSRFGAMGFALPGAIGANIALPEEPIVVVTGDGDIQMTIQELATIMELTLPLKIFVFNNASLGAIRQHQHTSYGRRFIGSTFERHLPFHAIASAYDIESEIVKNPHEIEEAVERSFEASGPYLINFILDPDTYLEHKISINEPLDSLICHVEPIIDSGE